MKEQRTPIKRRKLSKTKDEKILVQQVNPLIPPTGVISKPTLPVLDVKLRGIDKYDPLWPVDQALWKVCLTWKRSRKITNEERTVVFSFSKNEFLKCLNKTHAH